MQKSKRRAGQNIRGLAIKRRMQAIISFISAVFLISLPFILQTILGDLPNRLSTASNSQQLSALKLPPSLYLLFAIVSLGSMINGMYWWKRANQADQGAKGEEDVSKTLAELELVGWQLEYNINLGKGIGDADIFCLSPRRHAYVIDVKSHRGTVVADGHYLYRQIGHRKYQFEKDFLKQVMRQALRLKEQRNLKYVTPIVVFSDAKVSVKAGKLKNVYVAEKSRLPDLLKRLG
jgi:hypothetical protein